MENGVNTVINSFDEARAAILAAGYFKGNEETFANLREEKTKEGAFGFWYDDDLEVVIYEDGRIFTSGTGGL